MLHRIIRKFCKKTIVDHTCDLLRRLPEEAQQKVCEIALEAYVKEANLCPEGDSGRDQLSFPWPRS